MNLENQAHVKLYRWLDSKWNLQFTQKTTDLKIKQRLSEGENTPGFLMWEFIDSFGTNQGQILTSHIYLFDI